MLRSFNPCSSKQAKPSRHLGLTRTLQRVRGQSSSGAAGFHYLVPAAITSNPSLSLTLSHRLSTLKFTRMSTLSSLTCLSRIYGACELYRRRCRSSKWKKSTAQRRLMLSTKLTPCHGRGVSTNQSRSKESRNESRGQFLAVEHLARVWPTLVAKTQVAGREGNDWFLALPKSKAASPPNNATSSRYVQ